MFGISTRLLYRPLCSESAVCILNYTFYSLRSAWLEALLHSKKKKKKELSNVYSVAKQKKSLIGIGIGWYFIPVFLDTLIRHVQINYLDHVNT